MPPDILIIFLTLKGNLLFLSNESRKLTNNFVPFREFRSTKIRWKPYLQVQMYFRLKRYFKTYDGI